MVALHPAGLHFILFFGSVREPRNADRVAPFVKKALEDRNITVTVFDARDLHLDQVIKPIQYYEENETKPVDLVRLNSKIIDADGFIVMTAEYHGQIAPGLLSLMNQFPPNSYVYRPSSIVAYSKDQIGLLEEAEISNERLVGLGTDEKLQQIKGRFGGIRAAMQLRTYLADIGTLQVPMILSIPKVEDVFTKEGTTDNKDVHATMNAQIDQLVWFAEAIQLQRSTQGGYRCVGCYDENNLESKGLPYKNKKWS